MKTSRIDSQLADTRSDDELLRGFIAEKLGGVASPLAGALASAKAVFTAFTLDNRKTAEQKIRENDTLADAILLAVMIAEFRSLLALDAKIATMLDAVRQLDAELDQQFIDRYQARLAAADHLHAPLWQERGEVPVVYQSRLVEEAKKMLLSVTQMEADVRSRLQETWGGDTWEAGISKHVDRLSAKLSADHYAAFTKDVIEDFVPDKVPAPVMRKVIAKFAAASDDICRFLRDMPPPLVLPVADPKTVVVGEAAPLAPLLPPPVFTHLLKPRAGRDFEFKAAIHTVARMRDTYGDIKAEDIVPKKDIARTRHVVVDHNSVARMALRFFEKKVAPDVKDLYHHAEAFVHDHQLLKELGQLKKTAHERLAVLTEASEYATHHKPASPSMGKK